MRENENTIFKKIFQSFGYTFIIVIVFMMGVYSLLSMAYTDLSVEKSNTLVIICLCMGIIFSIFYCTFTVLDELRRRN